MSDYEMATDMVAEAFPWGQSVLVGRGAYDAGMFGVPATGPRAWALIKPEFENQSGAALLCLQSGAKNAVVWVHRCTRCGKTFGRGNIDTPEGFREERARERKGWRCEQVGNRCGVSNIEPRETPGYGDRHGYEA